MMTTSPIPRDAIIDGCYVAPSSGKDFTSGLRPLLSAAKNDLDSDFHQNDNKNYTHTRFNALRV
jgi:hypothetical protein